MKQAMPGAVDRLKLYDITQDHVAFLKVCHFLVRAMEDKSMDTTFSFKIEAMDEVTLSRAGCSWAFRLEGHVDTLAGCVEGVEGGLLECFKERLKDESGNLFTATCL